MPFLLGYCGCDRGCTAGVEILGEEDGPIRHVRDAQEGSGDEDGVQGHIGGCVDGPISGYCLPIGRETPTGEHLVDILCRGVTAQGHVPVDLVGFGGEHGPVGIQVGDGAVPGGFPDTHDLGHGEIGQLGPGGHDGPIDLPSDEPVSIYVVNIREGAAEGEFPTVSGHGVRASLYVGMVEGYVHAAEVCDGFDRVADCCHLDIGQPGDLPVYPGDGPMAENESLDGRRR